MKKIIAIILSLVSVVCMAFAFTGCENENADELIWTNDNAVYANIKMDFQQEILNDVEGAFDGLNFQKVYITNKTEEILTLLFILNENASSQQFIDILKDDERISGVRECLDLPFENVDKRYIDKEKDTIAVGEEMVLTLVMGEYAYYYQPFDFGGLIVKPGKDKDYSVRDFKGLNLKSVDKWGNGWMYLELAEENYFEVIKALDKLSRRTDIEFVEQDNITLITIIPPPEWEVSDETVAEIKDNNDNSSATIKGLKPGEVSVGFNGVWCKITVK